MIALILAAGTAGSGGAALAQDDKDLVVFCYDEALDLVTNRAPSQCDGRIIGEEEANEVKKRRLSRMRGIVTREKVEVVPGKTLVGMGSGFFVTRDGKLATNFHVVDDCAALSVLPPDEERRPAELVSTSKSFDFALLNVAGEPEAVATFRAPASRAADQRIAVIGYPMNAAMARIRPYFEEGRTLLPRRPNPGFLSLEFRADVRPGNSGGPLLDESGYVIGIVTAKINTVAVARNTGEVVTKIGYATDGEILSQFLRANGIAVTSSADGPVLEHEQIFEAAKRFSARVECWK